ncbi:sigma-54-dependent transcriptional regulator [Acanthopleuribacter pedis]|uniref:Sigma-54-dependent Fis family transcriptional regulator n=1 Tax=Acanthopleuribacter pedis TaxID=442870 RepID=A0A8J7QIW6_9BACT|nr:sigma-54 dependent transcriptional regulator [Acanthopleuribacter pedis]MBO1319030.1 sigma-54-dependent Fis family transcriptional regulator [Acanthopleuribacter pedis]
MARIMICDDEPSIRKTLAEILEDENHDCDTADSGESLLNQLRRAEARFDAVFLDVWLPGIDGVETLAKMREQGYQMPVIVISGHATLDLGVKATKLGAFDFLEKPLNLDKVMVTLNNALKQQQLERRQAQLEAQIPEEEMIGGSNAIVALKEDIQMAAPSTGRVLILGESGSGKELAARRIHFFSDRAREPFIEMNCAAIPENLIESELFGHHKGSFTDAKESKAGKFEQADGGTLFLDEIADMSLNTQAKVLRVLQEQRFHRVGGSKVIKVDVRVIAATNKDLEAEIEAGHFREDLYYRLNVIPLRVPPLRERPEDIMLLIAYFIKQFAGRYGRPNLAFTPEAERGLCGYHWPGNVRELRNIAERLVIMSRKSVLDLGDLPRQISGKSEDSSWFGKFDSLREAREDFERRYIEYQLNENGGNITKTAEILKLERSNLHKKMKQLKISPSTQP